MEESKNGISAFYAKTQAHWRQWLEKNHEKEISVWLIIYKKDASASSLPHANAVDEALCFGWIDSLTVKRDEESRYQLFSKRKAKSNWSAINKNKALTMIEKGLMHPAGLKTIETAKANGMWDALNDVENLIVPADLKKEFDANNTASGHWEKFPKSVKKAILKWISEAKREETRLARINETVKLAKDNVRVK
ncbi:YdeI/OmpD-associated family protein [Pedobacter roseus]|uniref:YdeI/OmpD-associated family protein n=1 Tax=Pedobacter roseus TaxID=336820 RepID=A0A7G9QAN1_9SPHI|nr:YdeI/OmpD-associated family protein [Pedobacter roseus]QNN40406.1 YdeI/OmpD-associated family protein [Pedobacter roseus]